MLGFLGWVISHATLQGSNWGSDMVVTVTLASWVVGFNVGIGSFNAIFRWMRGADQTHEDELYAAGVGQGRSGTSSSAPTTRWWAPSTSCWSWTLFGVGGTLAMMIRTQLMTPHSTSSPQTYNSIVTIHGMIMIIATIIMVSGPFTNFVLPIMIGAKDMAFPRLNALSFWLWCRPSVPAPVDLRARRRQRRVDDLRTAVRAGAAGHGRLRHHHHHLRGLGDRGRHQHHRRRSSPCGPRA